MFNLVAICLFLLFFQLPNNSLTDTAHTPCSRTDQTVSKCSWVTATHTCSELTHRALGTSISVFAHRGALSSRRLGPLAQWNPDGMIAQRRLGEPQAVYSKQPGCKPTPAKQQAEDLPLGLRQPHARRPRLKPEREPSRSPCLPRIS